MFKNITPENTILVPHPNLYQCRWESFQLLADDLLSPVFIATFRGLRPELMRIITEDIYRSHPEYPREEGFLSLNFFSQFFVEIPYPASDDYVRNWQAYLQGIGSAWREKYMFFPLTDKYIMEHYLTIQEDGYIKLHIYLLPLEDPSREDLIQAVRTLNFFMLQISMGVSHPSQEKKTIYLNGRDHFVEHPKLGTVPAGLFFVDLSEWNGETKTWIPGDNEVLYTGD